MKFEVHVTEAILRKAALHKLYRRQRIAFFVCAIVAINVVRAIVSGSLMFYLIGYLLSIAIPFGILYLIYLREIRAIEERKRVQAQGEEVVRCEVSSEGLRVTGGLGSGGTEVNVRWEMVKVLLLDDDYMLFKLKLKPEGKAKGELVLPRAEVSAKAVELIYEQLSLRRRPVKKAWG